MTIKHVEAGRKGGRPRFYRYPQGTPGVLTKGGTTTAAGVFPKAPRSSKQSARESLLIISN